MACRGSRCLNWYWRSASLAARPRRNGSAAGSRGFMGRRWKRARAAARRTWPEARGQLTRGASQLRRMLREPRSRRDGAGVRALVRRAMCGPLPDQIRPRRRLLPEVLAARLRQLQSIQFFPRGSDRSGASPVSRHVDRRGRTRGWRSRPGPLRGRGLASSRSHGCRASAEPQGWDGQSLPAPGRHRLAASFRYDDGSRVGARTDATAPQIHIEAIGADGQRRPLTRSKRGSCVDVDRGLARCGDGTIRPHSCLWSCAGRSGSPAGLPRRGLAGDALQNGPAALVVVRRPPHRCCRRDPFPQGSPPRRALAGGGRGRRDVRALESAVVEVHGSAKRRRQLADLRVVCTDGSGNRVARGARPSSTISRSTAT